MYTLYQRSRPDAADPLSMFWYHPQATGEWDRRLPMDGNFFNGEDAWASMRSSWTDATGLFVAMKAGQATGHQTRKQRIGSFASSVRTTDPLLWIDANLDAGDFVLDALGERWASELCQGDYMSPGYFSSEAADSQRWTYYQCGTRGQNTLLYNASNQMVDAKPVIQFATNGDFEGTPTNQGPQQADAYWIADLTNAYYGGVSIFRGVKLFNGRTQVVIQDEIRDAEHASQWKMHTNASMTISANGRQAGMQCEENQILSGG